MRGQCHCVTYPRGTRKATNGIFFFCKGDAFLRYPLAAVNFGRERARGNMATHTHCAVCLDCYTDAVLLPACGHSFCKLCVDALPTSRRNLLAAREALCPLCRAAYTPGSAVPNFGLRQSVDGAADGAVATHRIEQERAKWGSLPARAPPRPDRLAALGIPPGLSRVACDEARRVGLRLFVLDNSGSTAAMDGHVLRPGDRLLSSSRWEEICSLAASAAALADATGTPAEFHLLNPLRRGASVEGEDFVRTRGAADDGARLSTFLARVSPGGVTPLAERLRELRPRLEAFAAEAVRLHHAAPGRSTRQPVATHRSTPQHTAAHGITHSAPVKSHRSCNALPPPGFERPVRLPGARHRRSAHAVRQRHPHARRGGCGVARAARPHGGSAGAADSDPDPGPPLTTPPDH